MSDEQLTFESFAEYPISIAESKALSKRDARHWTPREALISVLRDIDSGKVSPTLMVIHWKTGKEDNSYTTGYAVAGGIKHEILGVMAEAVHEIIAGDLA